MKKACAWILSLMLALTAACGYAEPADPVFGALAGLEWSFSSGVGGWSTELYIQADGSFTGVFHDSEMGETGEDYPQGTLYGCTFLGRLALMEQADENAQRLRVEALALDEGQVPEAIEDGIRYVTTDPYGISEGDELVLYRPGTPLSVLSEDMLFWAHALGQENAQAQLETWFLANASRDSGFVGWAYPEEAFLPNPWQEMTETELMEASGLCFGVPEGAENIVYRFLPGESLAEMQFTLGGDEFCARIQPAALNEGELMNISGMYFAWENEEEITIRHCRGTIGQAQADSEDWAELCLWYDAAPGLMYSLSAFTTDPDGLDLTAIAHQVYLPVQGDD